MVGAKEGCGPSTVANVSSEDNQEVQGPVPEQSSSS